MSDMFFVWSLRLLKTAVHSYRDKTLIKQEKEIT